MKFKAYTWLKDGETEVCADVKVRADCSDENKVKKIARAVAHALYGYGVRVNAYQIERANIWINGAVWGCWLLDNENQTSYQIIAYHIYEDGSLGCTFIG